MQYTEAMSFVKTQNGSGIFCFLLKKNCEIFWKIQKNKY